MSKSNKTHLGPPFATILRLSRPNQPFGPNYVPPPYEFQLTFKNEPFKKFKVPKKLRHIRSKGIRKLAMPRVRYSKFVRSPPVGPPYPPVSPAALNYCPTDKIINLAHPRPMRVDPNLRENPYEVPKKALRPLSPHQRRVFDRLTKGDKKHSKLNLVRLNKILKT